MVRPEPVSYGKNMGPLDQRMSVCMKLNLFKL